MHQQRLADAALCFAKARAANPREAVLAFSHGTALRWLERHHEAVDAFKEATRLKPDYAEAYFEAGTTLQQLGEPEAAEAVFRQWLAALPGHPRGKMALADLFLTTQRPQAAEPLLREALLEPIPQEMRDDLQKMLGLALYRQGKCEEALKQYEQSAARDPDLNSIAARAEILERLKRYEEAANLSSVLVARDPANPQWHKLHNDLMYRLGNADYLKSFDRAPKTVNLLLSKAYYFTHEKRAEEAHQAYSEALALEPDNKIATTGLGNVLTMMKRHGEAQTVLEVLAAKPWGGSQYSGQYRGSGSCRRRPAKGRRFLRKKRGAGAS